MALSNTLAAAIKSVYIHARLAEERLRSGVAWWPLAPAFMADPYPAYQKLRDRDPDPLQHSHPAVRGVTLRRCGSHPAGSPELLQRPAEGAFLPRLAGHAEEAQAEHARAGSAGPHALAESGQPGVHPPFRREDGGLHPRHCAQSPRRGRRRRRVRPDESLRGAASSHRDCEDDRRPREGPGSLPGCGRIGWRARWSLSSLRRKWRMCSRPTESSPGTTRPLSSSAASSPATTWCRAL